jgi:hypothetical protein
MFPTASDEVTTAEIFALEKLTSDWAQAGLEPLTAHPAILGQSTAYNALFDAAQTRHRRRHRDHRAGRRILAAPICCPSCGISRSLTIGYDASWGQELRNMFLESNFRYYWTTLRIRLLHIRRRAYYRFRAFGEGIQGPARPVRPLGNPEPKRIVSPRPEFHPGLA